jgi:hypothetical protein
VIEYSPGEDLIAAVRQTGQARYVGLLFGKRPNVVIHKSGGSVGQLTVPGDGDAHHDPPFSHIADIVATGTGQRVASRLLRIHIVAGYVCR